VSRLAKGVAQPFETFVESITRSSAGRLDIPGALSETVKTKLVGDFGSVHGVRKILFVGKDKEKCVTELIFVEHSLEFLTCLHNTISVIGVDDKDDALGVLEVMPPQRPNLVLTANIPHCELDVLVFNGFNVEADCGNGGDNFTELEFIHGGKVKSERS